MALFNYATKEITLKIVYYGPGLSGKTTNLQYLHSSLNPETKGKLLSLSTEADRTLFFDFLPVELGKIRDFSIRFQLYTVPGQVRYNATRKVVLKGADAVIFVADSQSAMREQNIESLTNMRENLFANNINPDEIPVVLQYNKRDLKNISSIEELNSDLNSKNYPVIEASALKGTGVEESFKLITKLLLKYIAKKHKIEIQPIQEKEKKETEVAAEVAEPTPTAPSLELATEPLELAPAFELEEPAQKGIAGELDFGPLTGPLLSEKKESNILEKTRESSIPAEIETRLLGKKMEREITISGEIPDIASEKISQCVEEIAKLNGIVLELRDSLSALQKEMQDIREIRREQKETNSILKDIVNIFEGLKTKKSWFRF